MNPFPGIRQGRGSKVLAKGVEDEVVFEWLPGVIDNFKDRNRRLVPHHEGGLPCFEKFDRVAVTQTDRIRLIRLVDMIKVVTDRFPTVSAASFAMYLFHMVTYRQLSRNA